MTGISLQIKDNSKATFTLSKLLIYRDESMNWTGLITFTNPAGSQDYRSIFYFFILKHSHHSNVCTMNHFEDTASVTCASETFVCKDVVSVLHPPDCGLSGADGSRVRYEGPLLLVQFVLNGTLQYGHSK